MQDPQDWSFSEQRPPLRQDRLSHVWLALAAVCAGVLAGYLYYQGSADVPAPATMAPRGGQAAPPAAATAPPAPAIRHPIEVPPPPPGGLPSLDNSDSLMRQAIAGLLGRRAFDDMVIPVALVRRIVATVDNLPRPTAPRRMVPLNAVPGALAVARDGEAARIDERNFARYEPYVRVLEAVDTGALVATYARAYPLFQKAYEELGFPGRHFNDRLVEAIDDLLAAPPLPSPAALSRGRVLHEFADPDLESRSAGQKAMLRMGDANAARAKAKLREIRAAILAARPTP